MGCGRRRDQLRKNLNLLSTFVLAALLTQVRHLSSAAILVNEAGLRQQQQQNWTDEGRSARPIATHSTPSIGRYRWKRASAPAAPAQPTGTSASPGAPFRDHANKKLTRTRINEMTGPSEETSPITRYYRLYSRCSSRHLRIAGRHVDTLALPGDIYSELRVQTRGFNSQLTIQGSRSMNFLCFNKKGRLTVKHSGREKRCVFQEIHSSDHYTQFQSVVNPNWMIGFGRQGQKLHGDWTTRPPKQRKCFQFLKTDFRYLNDDLNRRGPLGQQAADKTGKTLRGTRPAIKLRHSVNT